jgi:hypothetical protein
MSSGGATYYLAYNQVGSLLAVIDTTGAIIKQLDYDSFGTILRFYSRLDIERNFLFFKTPIRP